MPSRSSSSLRVGVSLERRVEDLAVYLNGWHGYFGFCETPSTLRGLDQWVRWRLRAAVWRQWRRGPKRYAELRRRDVGHVLAAQTAGSACGPRRLGNSPAPAAKMGPNRFHQNRTVSWQISMPRSNKTRKEAESATAFAQLAGARHASAAEEPQDKA